MSDDELLDAHENEPEPALESALRDWYKARSCAAPDPAWLDRSEEDLLQVCRWWFECR